MPESTPASTLRPLPADLVLLVGSHDEAQFGREMCVMEAVAFVAGEPHSDTPTCACPVISAFLRSWNDSIPDDAHRTELLAPFVQDLGDRRSDTAALVAEEREQPDRGAAQLLRDIEERSHI